jgi:hypothetical protein
MLEVRLPVMKGEFRDRRDAVSLSRSLEGSVSAVREGSQEEKELLHRGAEITRKGSG